MRKYILIHGYAGKDLSHWLQWVETKLSKQNESVFFPSYTNSKTPDIDEWLNLFDGVFNNSSDEFTFIAHSIGCLVTMKLIEKYNIKVKDMLLVACPQNRIEAHSQLLNKMSDTEKKIFTKFVEREYNWRLIQSRVQKSTFFFSDDDFAIPYDDTYAYYTALFPNANFKTFHNYGHFNRKNDISELPEVMEVLNYV